MRVLLVEDDPVTSRSIELWLTNVNIDVYATDLGSEGIDLARLYNYDLILLDLDLPDMNGHDVVRQLRLARIETPVLILSAAADKENKLQGFGFGADDYMTKPFHREELVARIHAIIRRSKGHSQAVIKTGLIDVNLDAKTVEVKGKPVHLTGKEYQMLELLSLGKGMTLTKEMILNHLYGGMDEPELKIIDVFATKLRKKLSAAAGGVNYIETVWGRGYVLRDPESIREDEVVSDEPKCPGADADHNEYPESNFDGSGNDIEGSVFISYGGPDAEFAAAVDRTLTQAGFHTWFFSKDALPGEKLHRVMADGISKHDRVILLCSQNSLNRPGVLNEIERVLEKEAQIGGGDVLIPLSIDDYVYKEWQPERSDVAAQVRNRVITKIPNYEVQPKEFDEAMVRVKKALRLREK